MLNHNLCNVILFSLFSFFSLSKPIQAAPKRIQSIAFDKGETHRIFVVPGLASVIKFPCFGADALSGDESQVSVRFSPTTKKELQISMRSSFSRPTNLIVRCEGQSDHFVFDLIPSRSIHQDVLDVRIGYGRPDFVSENVPIAAKTIPKKIVVKEKELVGTSKRRSL